MIAIALLSAAALASTAVAPQVSLVSHVGQTGGGKPDHPLVTWQGDALEVRVDTFVTATRTISKEPPGVSVDGDHLRLCYRVDTHPPAAGQMAPLWAKPVLLQFTVRGLPKQTYAVTVADHCP